MILQNLQDRPGTAFILCLVLSAGTILISATPELLEELNRVTGLVLVLSYTSIVLALIMIYKSLRGDEARHVKNFKTVKR